MTASTAISGVFAPKLMHMVALDADKKTLTQVMIKVGRLQLFLLAVFLLGFFCLGKLFLTLWVGKSIGDEVGTVWLGAFFVLITLLVPLTQNTGISILQALNIHKGRAIILFWTSFICVVMGFTLSTFWGAIGMFIGTAVSLLFGQCFMINLYYAKKAGLHIRSYFKETYLPILLPASFLLLIGYFGFLYLDKSNSWTSFFSAGILYAFLCLSILWGFYLHREERNIFTSPFRFFLKKLRLMK
jgi:O-antigen/teichoic acid export membrane protein